LDGLILARGLSKEIGSDLGKSQTTTRARVAGYDLDTRVALIQALIPLGLQAVEDVLQQEVQTLAGLRYGRGDTAPHRVRWGRQRGSVYCSAPQLDETLCEA